jgi:hypothetical protein
MTQQTFTAGIKFSSLSPGDEARVERYTAGVAHACLNMTDTIQRQGCFHGFGYAFSLAYHGANTYIPMEKLCGRGDVIDRKMCVFGALVWMSAEFVKDPTVHESLCKPFQVVNRELFDSCTKPNMYGTSNMRLFYYTAEIRAASLTTA